MERNTSVSVAYSLLAEGISLQEIDRFVDWGTVSVDPEAETIPAPPPTSRGFEEDSIPTERCPAPPTTVLLPAAELVQSA